MARAAPLPLLALAASLALAPVRGRADPRPLSGDVAADGAATAGGWLLYLSSELAKDRLAPTRCRVCDGNAVDDAVRNLLVWDRPDAAARASDAVAFALVPAALGAHQLLAARRAGDAGEGLVDVLLVAEAAALAMNLNQAVKLAVARQRPSARHGSGVDRPHDPDDNLSFYSGHTTFAFTVAAAAGTVSDLRGYPSAPWVWGVGTAVAATAGFLRIAADRHYLTDVLVGAAVGTAVGIALPRLLHGREGGDGGAPSAVAVPLAFAAAF